MSVSALPSSVHAAPHVASAAAANLSRAADGDYKVANAKSSRVKDADGDYKPIGATGANAARSSPGVQSALAVLKIGG